MIKKMALFFVLVAFIISVYGCETTKGAFQGAKKDLQTVRKGAMNGWQIVCEGSKNSWKTAQKTDDWMRTNLW